MHSSLMWPGTDEGGFTRPERTDFNRRVVELRSRLTNFRTNPPVNLTEFEETSFQFLCTETTTVRLIVDREASKNAIVASEHALLHRLGIESNDDTLHDAPLPRLGLSQVQTPSCTLEYNFSGMCHMNIGLRYGPLKYAGFALLVLVSCPNSHSIYRTPYICETLPLSFSVSLTLVCCNCARTDSHCLGRGRKLYASWAKLATVHYGWLLLKFKPISTGTGMIGLCPLFACGYQ